MPSLLQPKGRRIMEKVSMNMRAIEAQVEMFAEARRRGYQLKVIASKAGLCESTVRKWADGTNGMPLDALGALARALPLDLLSLLLPDGLRLALCDGEAVDHAELAGKAAVYVGAFAQASHPDSEAGEKISHRERAGLDRQAEALQ